MDAVYELETTCARDASAIDAALQREVDRASITIDEQTSLKAGIAGRILNNRLQFIIDSLPLDLNLTAENMDPQ